MRQRHHLQSDSPTLATPFLLLRFAILLTIAAMAICGSVGDLSLAAAEKPNRPPNIIFIMADDLGYGELGCYGQKKIRTPHIDRLAAEGMRFTQCYAGSHVCQPSRSVLMTGLHTGHTAVRANHVDQLLLDEDVTVAEILKKQGYATGAFGKWGLGFEQTSGHPNRQGFDEFFGHLLQVHAHFYYPFWVWDNEERYAFPENENNKRGDYVHDVIHARAMEFIHLHKDEPFFAYLPYIIPHVELVVPDDSEKPYRGKFPKRAIPDPRANYIGSKDGLVTFAGMISRLDSHVGEIMRLLKQLELDENTIVIFTSDNGGQNGGKDKGWTAMTDFFEGNGPLRGYKGSYYEGGIRVPLIARWPGKISAGAVSDHICGFWDVLPTLSELAGAEIPEKTDGISLVPTLIQQGEQSLHEAIYWEYTSTEPWKSRAARMGRYKAVQNRPQSKIELYDLETDIGEQNNLAKQHPEIVAKLERFMDEQREPLREYPKLIDRPNVSNFVR